LQQLLELSVWADLRDGGQRARLLVATAPRLGFARVLVPTSGPLTGPSALIDAVLAAAPKGSRVTPCDPQERTDPGPSRAARIPTRPGRDLLAILSAAVPIAGAGGVAADVPVAIGRTQAEAVARAASDPVFTTVGTPIETGLFGRLEDVQAQVAVLAAAGARELCCILPADDLLDHLAQLASVAVGRLETHAPGLQRSPDPGPPAGWGGRTAP
jgi:hypothetical protein